MNLTSLKYRNWRSKFAEDNILLKDLKIKLKGNNDLIFEYVSKTDRENKFLYTRAETKQERDAWFRMLQSVYDPKKCIQEWKAELENKTNQKYFPELFRRMLGVLCVAKDATTSWSEVSDLSEYLAVIGIPQSMIELFSFIMKTMEVKHFTNNLLDEPSFDDSVDDGLCLLYIIRRLLWRFGYANKTFALAITNTSYLQILCNDLTHWLKTEYESGGNYLLFSSLDLIQQCARTTAPKSIFYDIGIKDVLASLIEHRSKDVRLASMIPLSHITKEEDIGLLRIDEDFLRFVLTILNRTIDNNSHSAYVNKTVPYYTNLSALFYFLGLLCQITENRNLILNVGVSEQLARVSKLETQKELLATLYLVDALSFSVYARKELLKDQILLERIEILKESNIDEIAKKAKSVYIHLYETDIPSSVINMDTDSVQLYLNAMKTGTTRARNARIIFLGHAGAGKTSLCRRFLGRSIEGVTSTVGIDIFIHRFIWDLQSKKWILQKLGNEIDTPTYKLAHMLRAYNTEGSCNTNVTTDEIGLKYAMLTKSFREEKTVTANEEGYIDMAGNCNTLQTTYRQDKVHLDENNADPISQEENFYSFDMHTGNIHLDKIRAVFCIEKELDIPENHAFVSLWDFAGQEEFYATHHIFLSSDAIYLIVLDMSEMDNNKAIDKARYWLKSILTHSTVVSDEDGVGFWCPPIILVGTHKDKLPGETNEEKEKYASQKFKELLDVSDTSGLDTSFIKHQFLIDNTIQDPKIQDIKESLIDLAKDQLHWEKDLPTKWFLLERELMILKEKGRKIITLDELNRVNETTESPIGSEKEITLFLNYLHEEGIVLFFSSYIDVTNYIIIDPQWIVHAFRRITSTPNSVEQQGNKNLRKLLKPLQKEGKLSKEYLHEVWSLDHRNCFLENQKILIRVMEILNLISKPIDTEFEHWFVPSMLKCTDLSAFLNKCDFYHKLAVRSCTLCLSIKKKIVPDFIFDRLLAACLSKWKLHEKDGNILLYRFMACFKVKVWKMILFCDGNTVQSVFYSLNTEATIPILVGMEALNFLQSCLSDILSIRTQYKGWDVCFLCKPVPSVEARPLKMSSIFTHGEVQCCDHQSTDIHHLRRTDIQQWIKMGDTLSVSIQTKTKINNSRGFPTIRHISRGIKRENTSQGFKRSRDTTITERDLDVIKLCCSSVGRLQVPGSSATVFRVGPCYVMTAFHVIHEIIYDETFSETGVRLEMKLSKLSQEYVYVIFSHTTQCKFYLEPVLLSYDIGLDYAVLQLKPAMEDPGKYIPLPPPFTGFQDESDLQELTAIIGYGHPHNEEKIIETRIKILPKCSERIVEAINEIQCHSTSLKNILADLGKDANKVDNAYTPIFNDWTVPVNCFMEKGSSGAPGFVIRGNDVKVVMMITGGLPIFYWDLPEEYRIHVAPKLRIEYGTSMRAVYNNIQDENLRKMIFGE